MKGAVPPRAFLDACVLFPPLLRTLLTDAAAEGLFLPLWSPRVLTEWRIAASARGAAAETAAAGAAVALRARFPEAEVAPDPALEDALDLPDPADRHVAAAAIAGGASLLVTFNLRDFPVRRLAPHGVEPRHPDGFLWALLGDDPDRMGRVLARTLGAEPSPRSVLKKAGLPRLGKAWRAG